MRGRALHGADVVESKVHPRRAWDLCSNHIVPMWITGKPNLHPISSNITCLAKQEGLHGCGDTHQWT